jgi:hypothetical protein
MINLPRKSFIGLTPGLKFASIKLGPANGKLWPCSQILDFVVKSLFAEIYFISDISLVRYNI